MSTEPDAQPVLCRPAVGGLLTAIRRRLRGLAVLAVCAAALWLAWQLRPIGSGYGTHRQLGLPACSVLMETGWPCPTCGLTTSVSALAHGNVGLAVRAHPFGVVLFAALCIGAGAGLLELATGRDVLGKARFSPWWIVAGAAGLLIGWAAKLIVGWAAGQLPVH